jgi:hypothetical protein
VLFAVPALRKDQTRISFEFPVVPLRRADGAAFAGMGTIVCDVTRPLEEMKGLRASARLQAYQVPGAISLRVERLTGCSATHGWRAPDA